MRFSMDSGIYAYIRLHTCDFRIHVSTCGLRVVGANLFALHACLRSGMAYSLKLDTTVSGLYYKELGCILHVITAVAVDHEE